MEIRGRVLFWTLVGLGSFGILWLLQDVLTPFVLALIIAYLLKAPTLRLERFGWPRWLAATLIFVVFFVGVFGSLTAIFPILIIELADLVDALPTYIERVQVWLRDVAARSPWLDQAPNLEDLRDFAGERGTALLGWAGSVAGGVLRSGVAAIAVLSLIVVTPIVAFYLLLDWEKMVQATRALIPLRERPTIEQVVRDMDAAVGGFLRGQATVCLILGSFYAIGMSIIGLNFAVLIGLIAGILSFIPYVGSITGFAMAVLVAAFQFQSVLMVGVTAGIFLFGQFVEGNFLTPRLVGRAVSVHPVWVMVALFAGGSLFGFTGVLLALPVAAMIGVLVRYAVGRYRQSPLYTGMQRPVLEGPGIDSDRVAVDPHRPDHDRSA